MIVSKTLISVNLTTFNRPKLLRRALNSIYSQTFKNIEVIVIDDNSSENYEKLIQDFSRVHKNFFYFKNNKNLGNAKSRNIALSKSKGEFIAFLDDDDFWIDKDKLKRQLNVLLKDKKEEIGFSFTSVEKYTSDDKKQKHIIKYPKNLKSKILSGNGFIYSTTVLIRKNLLLEIKGFDENFPRGIDSDLFRRIIINQRKKIHIDQKITTYVREFGLDRMTPIKTRKSIEKNLISHFLTLYKFNIIFLFYPYALLQRIYSITVSIWKLISIKI